MTSEPSNTTGLNAGGRAMLSCRGLTKHYGGVVSLADVSLDFLRPEIVAVVGPNGAGKSTLLNMWTGFVSADAGDTFIAGRNASKLAPYRIARLGIGRTFQDLRLITQLTVWENVALARPHQPGEGIWGALHRKTLRRQEAAQREEVRNWLRYVGVEEDETKLAGALSYGQQKLVALACALATGAKVLLLDEPVAGVHPTLRERFGELIREIKAAGKLVIFVEHDLAFVQEVAERLVVMEEGQIVCDGNPTSIFEQPELLKTFVGSLPHDGSTSRPPSP